MDGETVSNMDIKTFIIQDMRRHPAVQTAILRCWKCRQPLMDSSNLLSSHGEQLNLRDCEGKCEREDECTVWYINQENVPSWLTTEMDRGQWTKGKLHCPHCCGRLGSFNFVIPSRCPCGECMVPAVQFCKSRVDFEVTSPLSSGDTPSKLDFIRKDLCPAVKNGLSEPSQSLPSKTSLEACLQRPLYMPQPEHGKPERCTLEKILQASVPPTGPPATNVRRHRKCFSLDLRNGGGGSPAVYSPLAYRRSRSATAVWGKRDIGSSPCVPSLLAHFHREPADGEGSAILEDERENTHARRTLSCSATCGVSGSLRSRARNDDDGMSLRRSRGGYETAALGSASGAAARMLFSDSSSGSGSESGCEDEVQPSGALERPRLTLEFQRNREFAEGDAEERVPSEERSRAKRVGRNRRKGDRWIQKKQDMDRGKYDERSAEESEADAEMEGYTCAVCLDVYCSPHLCHPCRHVFCETCLRSLARDNPGSTPCPLCRVLIRRVTYQSALDDAAKLLFPRAYVARKRSDLRLHGPDWPLPGRQGGLRTIMASLRGASGRPGTQLRWHLPHAFRLDEDEEQSRGWLDMDRIIIYVYSINWLIGFVTFCCFCYLLFTSIF